MTFDKHNMKAIEKPPAECAASGQGCRFGPHGMNGEIQCAYCGIAAPFDVDEDTRLRLGVAITNYLTDPEAPAYTDWYDSSNVDFFVVEILRAIGKTEVTSPVHPSTVKTLQDLAALRRYDSNKGRGSSGLFYTLNVPVALMTRLDWAVEREQAPSVPRTSSTQTWTVEHLKHYPTEAVARLNATHSPINMVIHCPKCGRQHIDRVESEMQDDPLDPDNELGTFVVTWANPPHRSHKCNSCGCIWRAADVPTNGVEAVETEGAHDNWTPRNLKDLLA